MPEQRCQEKRHIVPTQSNWEKVKGKSEKGILEVLWWWRVDVAQNELLLLNPRLLLNRDCKNELFTAEEAVGMANTLRFCDRLECDYRSSISIMSAN